MGQSTSSARPGQDRARRSSHVRTGRTPLVGDLVTLRMASERLDPVTVDQVLGFRRHHQDDDREPYWQADEFAELLALVAREDAAGGEEP